MALTITKEVYGNYGNCIKLSNDICSLYVTTDIGPRIINYSLKGKNNVFMNDIQRSITFKSPAMAEHYDPDAIWYIYGGHRMWLSPENDVTTYYPDNTPIEYDIIGDSVRFYRVQKENGVKFTVTVTLCPDSSKVKIEHKCDNISKENKTFAIWGLSVMDGGGIGFTPMPAVKTGLLANRVLSLWDYSSMNDKRVYWGDRYITLTHDDKAEKAFKYGINLQEGWTAYLNHGQLFVKRFEVTKNGDYPDYGVSFESYSCAAFQELESLSKIVTVSPEQSTSHTESWELSECGQSLDPKDEDMIDEIVSKYIN